MSLTETLFAPLPSVGVAFGTSFSVAVFRAILGPFAAFVSVMNLLLLNLLCLV
jgi:hypothetical protein